MAEEEASVDSSLLDELGYSDDLLSIRDHSEQSLMETISSRFAAGMPFTTSGPVLFNITQREKASTFYTRDIRDAYSLPSSTLPPHIYQQSLKAYRRLKETKNS